MTSWALERFDTVVIQERVAEAERTAPPDQRVDLG
jgi:hypothetical protein